MPKANLAVLRPPKIFPYPLSESITICKKEKLPPIKSQMTLKILHPTVLYLW